MLNIDPVPITTLHLCMYAAYLARFLLPRSVCVYLNFVGLIHKEYGVNNPLLDNWTLSTVLRGMKRVKGVPPVPKLPMTPHILSFIHSQLNLSDSKQASFWAICLVAFFGLFRKSHLLPPTPKAFTSDTFLTRSDFTFCDSTLYIRVRWSINLLKLLKQYRRSRHHGWRRIDRNFFQFRPFLIGLKRLSAGEKHKNVRPDYSPARAKHKNTRTE